MLRIFLASLFIFITIPSYSQGRNGELNNKDGALWQKNGIIINDSQGRSVRQSAKLVRLDDNSSVIVWEDKRNGFTGIFAQRLSETGAKLWGKNGIGVCEARGNHSNPQIIGSGRSVVIAWQDYRGGNSDIYVQKMNLSGSSVWMKDGIKVCSAPTNQLEPQLADDGANGAIIAWYDYRSGKGEDIYAQKINKTGLAEWQSDGVPVCIETGTQWYPKMIPDGTGGAVICWDDKRGDYYDVYAQRLDNNGNPVWQANGIPVCSAPENQEYSQIASCEGDSFALVWQDYRNGNADIYMQKINLNGRFIWKTNGEMVCNVAGNQERPQVVGGPEPIIIWNDFRNGSGNSDIFCQKISSAGTPVWGLYGVSICEASGNQMNLKAVEDGTGGAVIAWQDQRHSRSGVFARRVNKDGKVLWATDGITVCRTGSDAEFPQVAMSNNGTAVIAWQDKRTGGLDVYAQLFNLSGTPQWKANGMEVVIGFGSVTQQKPKITRTGKDTYIVVWEDYKNGHSNIYAQLINNKGKLLWARDGLRICNSESNQYNPELISDDSGGAIIVWEDARDGDLNIYAQKVDQFGSLYWDGNGIKLCPAEESQINPKLAKDQKGGAIVAWQDSRKREGLYNIYSQRIDKNGSLLWKIDGVAAKSSEGPQTNLTIDSDGGEGAVITWEEYRRNLNTPDIFAQRISAKGNIMWASSGLSVCKAPESQKHPALAKGNEIIIAWQDSGGGNYDIYAQKSNIDGTVAWICDGVPVCIAPYTQIDPRLILNGDGGATFVWNDYRKANWDIFAQRLDTDGKRMWDGNGVEICTAPGTQYAPQLVKSREFSTIIAWEDYRNDESYNIFAQMISGNGDVLWEKDGRPVCITDGGARNPQLADDGEGGAVIVWTDYRDGNYDIYAQRINDFENK